MKNKLFKKIMGFAVAASLALSCTPSTFAEEQLSGIAGCTPASWGIESGAPLINTDHAHTGNASLYVPGGTRTTLIQWGDTSSANFNMGMWVYNPNGATVTIGSYFEYYEDAAYNFVKTEGDWSYYERSNFWLGRGNDPIRVYVEADKDILIDDVTFIRNDVQLFANTSFESYTISIDGASTVDAPAVIENAKLVGWYDETGATMYVTDQYSHSGNTAMYLEGNARIFQWADLSQTADYTIGFWVRYVGGTDVSFQTMLSWENVGDAVPTKKEGDWYYYERTWYNLTYQNNPIKINITAPTGVIIDGVTLTRSTDGFQFYTNSGMEDYFTPMDITKTLNNADITGWNKEKGTASISLDDAHTGKASLYVKDTATVMWQWMDLMEGDYTMDWWAKYVQTSDLTCYGQIDWDGNCYPQIIEKENGWIHFRATLHNGTNWRGCPVRFNIFAPSGILLDDITFTSPDGIQMFTNTSFEEYILPAKNVSNLIAYPAAAGGTAVLSWDNPNYNITSITVSQDGTALSDLTINTAAKSSNEIVVSGLENDREYTFTVTTTIGGEEFPLSASVTPTAKASSSYAGKNKIGSWTVTRSDSTVDGTTHYANIVSDLDSSEKASGNTAFKFSGKLENTYTNVYSGLSQTLKLQKKYRYQFFVKTKTRGVNVINVLEELADETDGTLRANLLTVSDGSSSASDWAEKNCMLATQNDGGDDLYDSLADDDDTYTATISINVTKLVGTAWIDDVALYALDEDGAIVSDNLLAEGGFEFAPYTISAKCGTMENGVFTETGTLKAGENTIRAIVKNENAGADFKAAVAVALYKDGRLVKVSDILSKSVAEGNWYNPTEEYTFTLNVPAENIADYSAKVLFWKDLSGMKPLGRAVGF